MYNANFTPVNSYNQYMGKSNAIPAMIDNYVYLYHTKTLIAIPTYPDQLTDTMGVSFSNITPLSRSAPIFSYVNSGPRSFQVTLNLHRDMMNYINLNGSSLGDLLHEDLSDPDYIDILVNQLQAAALPEYAASEKMVNPPIIAVRFGNELFCKGIVQGAVSVTYSGPILRTDKYASVSVEFTVNEIDPFDASLVMTTGSMRGFSLDLERNIWNSAQNTKNKR